MWTVKRKFVIAVALVATSLFASAYFYSRSSADFDRHAQAIAAIGRVRQLDERAAELVLAARYGLSNQYDSITATEENLGEAGRDLRDRIGAAVQPDRALTEALGRLEEALVRQRERVERFKAENSVLKNSLYYLPTAAEEATAALGRSASADEGASSLAIHRLVQAVLVHDLIGDQSTHEAYVAAFAELESKRETITPEARSKVSTLLAHAAVIGQWHRTVDAGVREAIDSGDREKIAAVEAAYHDRFGEVVSSATRYRRILYGWSLLLLAAASVAGLELRRLYASLERLVAERTAELRSALDALWGEMRLASKIQQALVPASPELGDCEIAAAMRATDAVGGDYYDVIRASEADWLLIGDVSGHGVPAGLIMMMCHTAVRTLLRSDPKIMPDRLLVAVNSVLAENIRQLGETKYMTITAFRRERDGTVFFSGAHQDIQIFRAPTNDVETIETSGVWLGLKAEIGDSMSTRQFRLAEGDVLLLHTDGITEACRDGKPFDTTGVRRVLGQARHKTAEQVLAAIFAELDGYSVTDDATVLAIKQLGSRDRVTEKGKGGHADHR